MSNCSGTFASAWQFAAFWFTGHVWTGNHDNAGPADAALRDLTIDFVSKGIQPNIGQKLWNVTQGTSGLIVAVSGNTVTATGVTWNNGDEYRISRLTTQERSSIEMGLSIASTDVKAVLRGSAQCSCVWADWAEEYVAKLTIIDAVTYYSNKCGQPRYTEEYRKTLMDWMNVQLKMIATAEIVLCQGQTNAFFPSIAFANQGWTEFQQAEIIVNDILENT